MCLICDYDLIEIRFNGIFYAKSIKILKKPLKIPSSKGCVTQFEGEELFAKSSKCEFWLQEVSFLGHVISKGGIAVHPSKVDAVLQWETPKSVFKIRYFSWFGGLLPEVY